MTSIKTKGIEIEGNLNSSGTLDLSDGYLFLGQSYIEEETNNNNQTPKKSYMGTSESKGNVSRDLYNMNTNGPIKFNNTQEDAKFIVSKFPTLVSEFPFLSNEPWIYPIAKNWTQQTEFNIGISPDFPIYKTLGKGLGTINFFKVAKPQPGNKTQAGNITEYKNNGITLGNLEKSIKEGPTYPSNGKILAGTLVQLYSQINEDGVKETCVIPYQTGRGIPMYSNNYQPTDVPSITQYPPWGELKWNDGETMSPSLASGVEPGNNNACVGIVLDTYTSTLPNKRIFIEKEPSPNQPAKDPHEKWFNHPAPHTTPAKSVKDGKIQGFLSPGPNLSSTYWSPWPDFYAYQSGSPIPILTRGVTTARIGAACNIALTSYGVKFNISATDETWIPVSCIPLFQGERLEAGSYIYSSVKGQLMTAGPSLPNPLSSNFIQSIRNLENPLPPLIGQTQWDEYIDATWGNIGWTGTPGLSFSNIPDSGVATMETLKGKHIENLNQSNQGSIIVQPITFIGPDPSLGNILVPFFLPSETNLPSFQLNPDNLSQIIKDRTNLPGVSGRCKLAQSVPNKAQPIGVLMESVEGTGKWTYTGLNTTEYDSTVAIIKGGASYPSLFTSTPTTGGTGAGAEAQWSQNITEPGFLGTLVEPVTLSSPGVGYTDGDILTIKDNSLLYSSTQYKGNTATVVIDTTTSELTLTSGGSGYTAYPDVFTHNMSKNSVYFSFDISVTGELSPSGVTVSEDWPQDFSRYPVGTQFKVIQGNNESAIIQVTGELSYTSTPITIISAGTGYLPFSQMNTIFETVQINTFALSPRLSINSSGGSVLSTSIKNYGSGTEKGDIILLAQEYDTGIVLGDQNAVINFPGMPPGGQDIIVGCPCYPKGTIFQTQDDLGNLQTLTLETLSIDPLVQDKNVPTSWNIVAPGAVDFSGTVFTNGGQNMIEPWYISRNYRIKYEGGVVTPMQGGQGYNTNNTYGLTTFNISANSLRMRFTVVGGLITAKVSGDPVSDIFDFNDDRYIFDPVEGTEVRLLTDFIPEDQQTIVKLVAPPPNIQTVFIKNTSVFNALPDGDYMFHTQRLDQENPIVSCSTLNELDIGFNQQMFSYINLEEPGVNNKKDDIILVVNKEEQKNISNVIFRYNDNRPTADFPPFAKVRGFKVENTSNAWKRYSEIMSTTLNLLDKQVLIELRPTAPVTLEDEGPSSTLRTSLMPQTKNYWKEFY